MWDDQDSQDVGLEAATIERVRNSLLVEPFCADNVRGLKPVTEAADFLISPTGQPEPGNRNRVTGTG
jgi:hypothetical protein